MRRYDLVVSDCEGASWDSAFTERDSAGSNVRQYVNSGGRLFASHLSFSWLHENGAEPFTTGDPIATASLAPASGTPRSTPRRSASPESH
jgi:hypothetical protein